MYDVWPSDFEAFRRCRRAWDLGSPARQGYELRRAAEALDVAAAVRDALDVWYFPGMWQWQRAVVRPLAMQAFYRAMRDQTPGRSDLPPGEEGVWGTLG